MFFGLASGLRLPSPPSLSIIDLGSFVNSLRFLLNLILKSGREFLGFKSRTSFSTVSTVSDL